MLRLLTMRLLTRVWLLAGSLSVVSLLILGRCGIQENTALTGDKGEAVPNTAAYVSLLEQREEENRAEVARLTEEIRALKLQLLQLTSPENGYSIHQLEPTINISNCSSYVRHQVESAEILQGVPLNNEYELIPFNHFTLNRVYPIDLGLGKRVVEKPIGFKRKDLLEIIVSGLEILNKNTWNHLKHKHTLDDFLEGVYRIIPTTGTEYEVYYKTKLDKSGFTKITIMRPFAPLLTLSNSVLPTVKEKEIIHIILPLCGRISTFQGFMDKFVKIALKNDKRVLLTVVYFGEDKLSDARIIMSRVAGKNGHGSNLRLLALNETFSRGKGLRVGAERTWDEPGILPEGQDVLLFMCDVDIVFSARFLDRCRWNAKAGSQVYYPVVFSLYNPHVVYTLQGKKVPSETDQLVISRDTGFWRDFGYGMTCQYKSDFLRVRGFDEEIMGWGLEDVMLYRKYVRSRIKVVRATDPGIFHIWHPKVCTGDQQMSADQYRACIRSRALNEASHAQLGFLAFREDITRRRDKTSSTRKTTKKSNKKNTSSEQKQKHFDKKKTQTLQSVNNRENGVNSDKAKEKSEKLTNTEINNDNKDILTSSVKEET